MKRKCKKNCRKSVLSLNVYHKYNSKSLVAVLHMNKSNAAGNSKRLYTPDLESHLVGSEASHMFVKTKQKLCANVLKVAPKHL